jgi:hypothetical protein
MQQDTGIVRPCRKQVSEVNLQLIIGIGVGFYKVRPVCAIMQKLPEVERLGFPLEYY